jgi:hypothetical protein
MIRDRLNPMPALRTAVLVLLLVGHAACSTPWSDVRAQDSRDGQAAALGREFTLRPGATARVTGESIAVAFEGVAGDSRCPVDVTCVWAGDAVVTLTLAVGTAEPTRIELHTNPSFQREALVAGYRVALNALAPSRRTGVDIPQSGYEATIVVTRRDAP